MFKKIDAPRKPTKPNRTGRFFLFCGPKRFGGCTNHTVCGLYGLQFDFKPNRPRKYKKYIIIKITLTVPRTRIIIKITLYFYNNI